MNKGELLLKLWQELKNLCTEAKMLANFIQKIPEENTRKRLTIKLGLNNFLYADIRNDVSDVAEISDSNFLEEARKLFALIQSQRFCFYFSSLYAYKNADVQFSGDSIKSLLTTLFFHVRIVINGLADLNAFCQNQYDHHSWIISICNNKIKKYVDVIEKEKIDGLDVCQMWLSYFNALKKVRHEDFITAAELHSLLKCLIGKIPPLRQVLQTYRGNDAKDRAEKNIPPLNKIFFIHVLYFFLYLVTFVYAMNNIPYRSLILMRERESELSVLLAVLPFFLILKERMEQKKMYENRITNRQTEFVKKGLDYLTETMIRYVLSKKNFSIPNDVWYQIYKEEKIFASALLLMDSIEFILSKDLKDVYHQMGKEQNLLMSFGQMKFLHSNALLMFLRLQLCKTKTEETFILPEMPLESVEATPLAQNTKVIEVKGKFYVLCDRLTRKDAENLYQQTGISINLPQGANDVDVSTGLGKGNYGKLRLAYDNRNKEYVGVKIVDALKVLQEVEDESMLHRALSNLNCSALIFPIGTVFGTSEQYKPIRYQFIPLAGFGDGQRLKEKLFYLSVDKQILFIQYVLKSLTVGLSKMHQHFFYHLDFKLANFVLTQKGDVWIIDFGCTRHFPKEEDRRLSKDIKADKTYYPPERFANYRLQQQQDFPSTETVPFYAPAPVDAWALGMVLLELILKRHPFLTEKYENPVMRLRDWNLKFYQACLSDCFRDSAFIQFEQQCAALTTIVKGLLEVEVSKRWSLVNVGDAVSNVSAFPNEGSRQNAFLALHTQSVMSAPSAANKTEEEQSASDTPGLGHRYD